jgi:putative ABC transport system ATP-binding protein
VWHKRHKRKPGKTAAACSAVLADKYMIECIKINKIYENGDIKTPVLKEVSIKIEKGELVAIVGPSGSGKSTLMHIIGALDTPTSGQYLLEGQDVSKLTDEELAEIRKSKIGFVFQTFNLLPRSTVIRNVVLPLVYAEVPAEKREELAKTALRSAGLEEERWNHLTNQLSGGQMQRVAIARALVNNPAIILADEPTGNLDTKTGQIVLSAFQDLNKKEGHTIVIITHDREVAAYADRIIYIRDGMIENKV